MPIFKLTPKMQSLLPTELLGLVENHEVELVCDERRARDMIHVFTQIVNSRAAFMNIDKDHTSALAAIKRIRRALGLKGTLEAWAGKRGGTNT